MDVTDDAPATIDNDILVCSSQRDENSSPRPRKRRRLNSFPSLSDDDSSSESSSDQNDLPSNNEEASQDFDESERANHDSLIHQQMIAEAQTNVFVTQIDQPWSSPTRIRGPRWRKKTPTPSPISPPRIQHLSPKQALSRLSASRRPLIRADRTDDFDDDELDALLADQDLENAILEDADVTIEHAHVRHGQPTSLRQSTLFGVGTTQRKRQGTSTQVRAHNWPLASRNGPPSHHKLNETAMKTWIYPLNVGTIRDYQYNIVHKALFNNTLVALPTGLGKTFIAATVMLNWFNWTEGTQLVFMAPTKPLVAQQVDACFNIAGIPRSQTTLLTGEIPVPVRVEEWQEKRVFFMTPQTFLNDLKNGIADPKKIVLVVVDEAHKATGNYAYVEVIRFLRRFNSSFRVLALTATPGASVEAVQKVIDGLDIARVEIRTEESLDIRAFVHSRNTELEFFEYSEEMKMCLDLFGAATQSVMDKLCSQNAYWSKDPTAITVYGLMQARKQWMGSEAGRNANWGLKSMINACFTPLMSLAHSLELLKFHGMGSFYHKLKIFEQEAGNGKYVKMITGHEDFKKLITRLKGWINNEEFVGHPKLSYLNTVVLNHFMDAGDGLGRASGRPPSDTRIMIFAHYRDSAEEINRFLNRHQPMIRAHIFVGQSGTKGSEGMNQKMQIDIIKKFKTGTYNVLVATSIGEEGLDIGEVDLIICYDCSKSPIRMLQRMGRTGRKRAGNIVLLLMRGKEERDYYSAKDNYSKIQEIIESGREFEFHDDRSPRIVPRDIVPVVDKRCVDIPIENTQVGSIEPKKRKSKVTKKPPKKFHMPDGVETGFSFLGPGRKNVTKESKTSHTLIADQTIATLPCLQDVLLSAQEESELHDRYAQIAGTESQIIQVISLGSRPEKLRQKDRTKLIQHSKFTERLLEACECMVAKDHNWERPTMSDIVSDFPTEPRIEEVRSTNGDIACASFSSNTIALDVDQDEYDTRNDFIDDGPVRSLHSDSESEVSFVDIRAQAPNRKVENRIRLSQITVGSGQSDQDLPDMGDLFAVTRPGKQASLQPARTRSIRRVISDDEEEEESGQ